MLIQGGVSDNVKISTRKKHSDKKRIRAKMRSRTLLRGINESGKKIYKEEGKTFECHHVTG